MRQKNSWYFRSLFFLFILGLMGIKCSAQQNKNSINLSLLPSPGWNGIFPSGLDMISKISPKILPEDLRAIQVSPLVVVDHLGYFCQLEIHMEKATGIPFKFRLGSVDYTDHLEGKDR
ncbi:MAG: hypothetical protein ACYCOO_01560 [Chitinophagaceae bacterium]